MAKIRKRGKTISIKFENKRESSNFLRAVGFTSIPALQDEQAVEHNVQRTGLWRCLDCKCENGVEYSVCVHCKSPRR